MRHYQSQRSPETTNFLGAPNDSRRQPTRERQLELQLDPRQVVATKILYEAPAQKTEPIQAETAK